MATGLSRVPDRVFALAAVALLATEAVPARAQFVERRAGVVPDVAASPRDPEPRPSNRRRPALRS